MHPLCCTHDATVPLKRHFHTVQAIFVRIVVVLALDYSHCTCCLDCFFSSGASPAGTLGSRGSFCRKLMQVIWSHVFSCLCTTNVLKLVKGVLQLLVAL